MELPTASPTAVSVPNPPLPTTPTAQSNPANDLPKDAKLIAHILKSMGVDEYEPRVVNQLLEFMYRYVGDVIQEAQVYAVHANKSQIDLSDVRLAIQSKVNSTFTQPPPRELLLEFARCKNSLPLTSIPTKPGVVLPQETYQLTAINYQIEAKKRKRETKNNEEAKKETVSAMDTSESTPTPTQPQTTPKIKFNLANIPANKSETQ